MSSQWWPTAVPGMPYRWVTDLTRTDSAASCPTHRAATDELGVCAPCLVTWRRQHGATTPEQWEVCRVCGLPLHPTVEAEGADTCPSCDDSELEEAIE